MRSWIAVLPTRISVCRVLMRPLWLRTRMRAVIARPLSVVIPAWRCRMLLPCPVWAGGRVLIVDLGQRRHIGHSRVVSTVPRRRSLNRRVGVSGSERCGFRKWWRRGGHGIVIRLRGQGLEGCSAGSDCAVTGEFGRVGGVVGLHCS